MPNPSDHPALDAYNHYRITNFAPLASRDIGYYSCQVKADALRDEYEARIKALEAANASLLAEARAHAEEARVQRGTVNECLQVASGSTGEKGDWHGAQPVRDRIEALKAELAAERGKRCGTCGWFQLKSWSPRPQCMCDECSFDEEPGPYYGCAHWTSAEQGATDE